MFTGHAGKLVHLEQTISGFQEILSGKYDHLPEVAFYMVGDISEVSDMVARACRLDGGSTQVCLPSAVSGCGQGRAPRCGNVVKEDPCLRKGPPIRRLIAS